MVKLLNFTVILCGFLIIFSLYLKKTNKFQDIPLEEPIIEQEYRKKLPLVDKINEKNRKIDSVVVHSMPVKVKSNGFSFRLSGDLAHKKDKFFRFIVTSKITGREMDLGSNQNIFWFWSKRVNPPSLYFAKHEDLYKTNLKTPLNPAWMIESLNVGAIDQSKIYASKEDDVYLYLYEKRITASGEDCVFMTVINKKSEEVQSRKLMDMNSNVIVSTIYKDNIIFIDWKDENASMEWDVKGKQINVNLPDSLWNLPEYKNKVNIGE